MVAGRLTSLRPATADDAELLAAWHADPEVSRYWDDETFTVEEVRARLERGEVDSWIVEAGGKPVGYLQSWREPDEAPRGGIDMFLVPGARGRGFGPDAGRALALHLLASGRAPSRSTRTSGTSARSPPGARPASARSRSGRPTTSTPRPGC